VDTPPDPSEGSFALEAAVWIMVALAEEPKHGYAIMRDIQNLGGFSMRPGTLYAALARMERADPGWAKVLSHLADTGPSVADDVEVELGLKHKELRSLRSPLQRCGALVARSVVLPAESGDGHVHRSELARFDQAYPQPSGKPLDIVALMGAALRAAVLAPEKDLVRWFSWRWLLPADLAEQLIDRGVAVRPAGGWLAAPPPA